MDFTTGRAARNEWGDYPHPATTELITALAVVGACVEQLTGNDLCNWETGLTYVTERFALRGSGHPDPDAPNFSFGAAPTGIDVAWYKELGRGTTVSRPVGADEARALAAACLTSLPGPVPAHLDDLWVYAGHAGPAFVESILAAARATA